MVADDHVVAAGSRSHLRDDLLVHRLVVDRFDLHLHTGLLGEFFGGFLHVGGVRHGFHQNMDGIHLFLRLRNGGSACPASGNADAHDDRQAYRQCIFQQFRFHVFTSLCV